MEFKKVFNIVLKVWLSLLLINGVVAVLLFIVIATLVSSGILVYAPRVY